jgi:hypothetical protein
LGHGANLIFVQLEELLVLLRVVLVFLLLFVCVKFIRGLIVVPSYINQEWFVIAPGCALTLGPLYFLKVAEEVDGVSTPYASHVLSVLVFLFLTFMAGPHGFKPLSDLATNLWQVFRLPLISV